MERRMSNRILGISVGHWVCGAAALLLANSHTAQAGTLLRGERLEMARVGSSHLQKPTAPAPAKGKKKPAAAKKDPKAAAAAQASAAAGESNAARANAQAAADAVKNAMSELRRLEDDLVEAHSEDSPLGQAKAKFEKLQEERARAVELLLAAPEYQSALARLGGTGERDPEDVAKLRERMIDRNEVVVSISADLKLAREEFQSLRKKALEEDAGWKAAVENVASLRKEQSAAEADARKALTQKFRAQDIVEQAARQARIAALIKQQQALAKKQAEAA